MAAKTHDLLSLEVNKHFIAGSIAEVDSQMASTESNDELIDAILTPVTPK
jgi:hypothetical protein